MITEEKSEKARECEAVGGIAPAKKNVRCTDIRKHTERNAENQVDRHVLHKLY